jgi:hypothetical protein
VWRPVGLAEPDRAPARGQPSTEPSRALSGSAPGLARGSPWGRPRGGHTPSTRPAPGAIPGGWPSRRSARPARAWLLRLTRSLGDQAGLRSRPREEALISGNSFVDWRRFSLYSVVVLAETPADGPVDAVSVIVGACDQRRIGTGTRRRPRTQTVRAALSRWPTALVDWVGRCGGARWFA